MTASRAAPAGEAPKVRIISTDRRRASAVALALRWLGVAFNAVLVWFTRGPHTIRWLAFLAVGLGALAGLIEHILPLVWRDYRRLMRRPGASLVLGAYDMAWMALLVYASGGVEHGFWTRYFVFLVARAILLPPGYMVAFLVLAESSFVGATALARGLTLNTVGVVGQAAFSMFLVSAYAISILSSQRSAARRNTELVRFLAEQNQYAAEAFAQLLTGDFSEGVILKVAETPDPQAAEAMHQLSKTFSSFVGQLRGMVEQVKSSGSHVAGASQQLLSQAEQETATAAQQVAAITETSTTMEELAATAAQIAEQAETVAQLAQDTTSRSVEGNSAAGDTASRMDAIAQKASGLRDRTLHMGELSQEIGSILALIDEISDQTNLLALNAAIEAARAGESGRGFSVVAEEVRKLAERSQMATKDVRSLVGEIRAESDEMIRATEEQTTEISRGTDAASSVAVALSRIADMAERTTGSAKEISIATAQQRSASDQIVEAMSHVSESSRQFAAGSHQATSSAAELARLAQELTDAMKQFRVA
jgi:methyl-accepting chemotaxis protein